MRLEIDDIAAAVGGTAVLAPGIDGSATIDGASQDSREIAPGQLFVPLVAKRDGHEFVAAAAAAGAAAYLSSSGVVAGAEDLSCIEVEDTAVALTRLGAACRWRTKATVVGITGSVGKTTTKDLMIAACGPGRAVFANPRSFNNEIGVPLTLINSPGDTDLLILEMGARDAGHIASLCDLARPSIGVITMVGAAHTEVFGSIAAVIEAKGELIECLPPDGLSVLNAEQPEVLAMRRRTTAETLTFGEGGDVRATEVVMGNSHSPLSASFVAHTPWGSVSVELAARGRHNISNALAALCVAGWTGTAIEAAADALTGAQMSPQRMDVRTLSGGATLIDDSYNANPMSMRAALDGLAELDVGIDGRRIAVLGTMAELADGGIDEHIEVARYAGSLGIEVVAYRSDAYGVESVTSPREAVDRLGALDASSAVLVKASRVAQLEEVVALLDSMSAV
ncbi:MAG: UDP-N-acetylmuramoyl-tripeptide--D-alanyl-D-alanine ligase [Acidobacteria bacterium]|nr:UDP-N-acetylmuramoyl-tripeptide--D-alanyl-D-alanine ligase [Acidobacteriota bacterium]